MFTINSFEEFFWFAVCVTAAFAIVELKEGSHRRYY